MRKSWCIGKEDRPTKTEISTMTFSICDAGVSLYSATALHWGQECWNLVNAKTQTHERLQENLIEWAVSDAPVPYEDAVAFMEARAGEIAVGKARQLVWLLEHPALYTAGTSAKDTDLLGPTAFPVIKSGRGGQYTYHGPGQRVVYLMLDLRLRGRDIAAFVREVEAWVIEALAAFNVKGQMRCGRVGVWVDRTISGGPIREDKIAAIGLRVRRWVSFHGISLNVEPNLNHFDAIVPCGITEEGLGVTSLVDLGLPVTMQEADVALRASFEACLGALLDVPAPLANE
jgi:lipoyl(octanoyl) transferase